MKPFEIAIPQADIDDLRARIARTRWTRELPGEGWERGVPAGYLREMALYWADGFDWKAQEAALNELPQFIASIEGSDVHFLHIPSANPDALALVLTHGWPYSFLEFVTEIPYLTDHFHLVIPSVPGFGFSEPPGEAGFSVNRVARMWAALMRELGYDRFGAQGGDFGAYVAPELARVAPDRVVGVHIDAGLGMPEEGEEGYELLLEWAGKGLDHHRLLRAAPATAASAWDDSPVGLLAFMLQKFKEFSITAETPEQVIPRDQLLTNASLYWFTRTIGTASWPMYDTAKSTWPEGQKLVPSGTYGGGPELFRRLAERDNLIVHWPDDNPVTGHFVAVENPAAHAADIIGFFTNLPPR